MNGPYVLLAVKSNETVFLLWVSLVFEVQCTWFSGSEEITCFHISLENKNVLFCNRLREAALVSAISTPQAILTSGSGLELSHPVSNCDELCKLYFQVSESNLRCTGYRGQKCRFSFSFATTLCAFIFIKY